MWRADPAPVINGGGPRLSSRRTMFGRAFAVTALNPKSIAFFVAFLPQFITPAAPVLPQMLVLGATFLVLATVNAAGYAVLAGGVRTTIRRPAVLRAVNRLGGGILIGAGVVTATLKRAG